LTINAINSGTKQITTDYRVSENEAFELMKCIRLSDDMCRMGHSRSFWSWFDRDVNRTTFHEYMRERK